MIDNCTCGGPRTIYLSSDGLICGRCYERTMIRGGQEVAMIVGAAVSRQYKENKATEAARLRGEDPPGLIAARARDAASAGPPMLNTCFYQSQEQEWLSRPTQICGGNPDYPLPLSDEYAAKLGVDPVTKKPVSDHA